VQNRKGFNKMWEAETVRMGEKRRPWGPTRETPNEPRHQNTTKRKSLAKPGAAKKKERDSSPKSGPERKNCEKSEKTPPHPPQGGQGKAPPTWWGKKEAHRLQERKLSKKKLPAGSPRTQGRPTKTGLKKKGFALPWTAGSPEKPRGGENRTEIKPPPTTKKKTEGGN